MLDKTVLCNRRLPGQGAHLNRKLTSETVAPGTMCYACRGSKEISTSWDAGHPIVDDQAHLLPYERDLATRVGEFMTEIGEEQRRLIDQGRELDKQPYQLRPRRKADTLAGSKQNSNHSPSVTKGVTKRRSPNKRKAPAKR